MGLFIFASLDAVDAVPQMMKDRPGLTSALFLCFHVVFVFLRPPSGWLGLDRSVLDFVALTIGAGPGKKAELPATPTRTQSTAPPASTYPAEAKLRSTW